MDLDVMEREYDADVDMDPAIDDVGLNDVYGRVGLGGVLQDDLSVGGAAQSGSESTVAKCLVEVSQGRKVMVEVLAGEKLQECKRGFLVWLLVKGLSQQFVVMELRMLWKTKSRLLGMLTTPAKFSMATKSTVDTFVCKCHTCSPKTYWHL